MAFFTKCINTIARCTIQYRSEKLEGSQINGYQCVYILNVCQHPGISQDSLADLIYINKSNVTRQLTLLEESGFVTRKTSNEDRRVIEVYPTQKAIDALPRVRSVIREWNDYLTADFSEDEKKVFEGLLQRMTDKAKKYFEKPTKE